MEQTPSELIRTPSELIVVRDTPLVRYTRPPPAEACPLCLRPFAGVDRGGGSPNTPAWYPTPAYFCSLPRVPTEPEDGGDVTPPVDYDEEASHNGYYNQYFHEIRKLGQGAFGAVYICQHVVGGVDLGIFAVKKIPFGDDASYFKQVLKEVRISEKVRRHHNTVEYNHSWIDWARTADFGPVVKCLFILMEYATEGSLDDYLLRHGKNLSIPAIWYFFLSAVAGVAHLHAHDILHRDIKPQNLLLTKEADSHDDIQLPRLLVSDFGTAAILGEQVGRTGATGTLEYMAPELFVTDEANPSGYLYEASRASDVWSLGMVLHYLMASGSLPTPSMDGQRLIFAPQIAHRPPEMQELLRSMLNRDPSLRPSCDGILNSAVVCDLRQRYAQRGWVHHVHQPSPGAAPVSTAPTLASPIRAARGTLTLTPHGKRGRNENDSNENLVDTALPPPPLLLPPPGHPEAAHQKQGEQGGDFFTRLLYFLVIGKVPVPVVIAIMALLMVTGRRDG